jgi:3-methyl-2-oxobutanoate hydroxymethyltransferase
MPDQDPVSAFRALKGQRKIVCLTAYTAPMAAALDPHCDLMLVGDSLAMVVYGMDNTRDIDLDTMIRHGKAVMRRRETALVVIDLPAGSYEDSPQQALASARRVIDETGAHGVKLEGGIAMQAHVHAISGSGIPVMGHIGLLPQHAASVKQFRITGKTDEEASQLMRDCEALAEAGVFSIVMEGMIEPVASAVAAACPVPSIGIGASPNCDGQILVTEDMLGMFDAYIPKFVRKFATLQPDITAAAIAYQQAVISGDFPEADHLYYLEGEKKT